MRATLFSWVVFGVLLLSGKAWASASDNATDPAYSSGLTNGSNGGTGFGPWTRLDSFGAGAFIGSSAGNGGASSIDTSGKAFGLNAQGNSSGGFTRSILARSFSQGALTSGQTFSFDLDLGPDNFQAIGLAEQDTPSGPYAIGPNILRSAGDFFVADSGSDWFTPAVRDSGIPISQDVHAVFTIGSNSYSLSLHSISSSLTYSTSGSLQGLSLNRLYAEVDGGSTADPAGAMYFNSPGIDVVPEPSAGLLLPLSVFFLGRRRQKTPEISPG
jgi:hypothetical protein